jgi:lysophospholipase L1-like esterase
MLRRWAKGWAAALAAIMLLGVATSASAGSKEFFFKDGDTIVVMGDSITEQRLYSNYLEMWTVSRFPKWKLTFRNVGIGGDRSVGGNSRFKRDVLAHKPTALTVDFGMNDGGYRAFDQKLFDTYIKGLQGIADQAKEAKIRVAFITPQPVEHQPGNKAESYNETLEKFSEGVKEVAQKNGFVFVDQFHPYWAVIKKARDAGETGRITGGDAVHPGPPGQAVMAASILKGLNFPKLVSSMDIVITEKGPGEVRTKNCKHYDLGAKTPEGKEADTVTFKRHDFALPFFPEKAESILKWTPLLEEMNDYHLKITGLKEGQYEIRLGGKKVAEHSAAELARGVNLAAAVLKTGPIADQVKKVWKAVQDKTNYFHDQVFRGVLLADVKKSPLFKDLPADKIQAMRDELYSERMPKMRELDAAIRAALVTQPYLVEIVQVKK